ncbi:outer membrane protein transport protein [Photobacterium sp. ZSDE20]|uniref:Outer membrane protein transport protein n=1 Tax=Photobacterium pectinilyticum TaxID=2906793 RepID=A0ABT1N658_9GAMM|nr:outer membrane protein transport protein [Photobacterium sp. ZSDE20]MCQ1059592.1 outer membrane protein transport protein [Photobacterium sp. ZSDE20]MDD1825455.1 outer membrane protein transport protein [Photobacterium sp. ZSDE20]
MNKNKITLSLASALTLGISTNTMAAGFQLAEYSATGLGRAFAGEAAMADNASAQFRNPAMMTYLEGTQVSVGAIYVDPNIDVNGDVSLLGQQVATTKASDIAHSAVIPNFYISHRVNEQWAVGLALATNYGMETELGGDFLGTIFGNQANIMSVEINPNIAYKINDQFSVGAGIRYVMGEGHFGAALPMGGPDLKYMEGDDAAWGWQLGGAWQINEANRIGFNYRSAVDLKLKGEASGLLYGGVHSGSMALTLPATAEIASYHQLTDKLAMHASFNWTDWSSFDKLEASIPSISATPDLIKEENWEDNYRIALGATYQYTNKLAVRTGVAYDTSAVSDEHRTQTIPETDRLWLSLGAGYQWSDALSFDAGFTYIFAKDASMDESLDVNGTPIASFSGETTGNVWLAGIQANYRF